MPEGDVVWRVARELDAALGGRALTRSDFRVPRFATTNLTGRSVHQAISRGKHLLIRVDGGVTIHTHLRMDGSWRIRPAGRYPPRDHRVRLVLENDEWQAVGYLLGISERSKHGLHTRGRKCGKEILQIESQHDVLAHMRRRKSDDRSSFDEPLDCRMRRDPIEDR